MPTEILSESTTLKKKASFRDRIKSWQKPSFIGVSTLDVIEEPNEQTNTQRFVYQPKHAAADFERVGITSGRSQHSNWKPAAPKPLEPVTEGATIRHSHSQSRRRPDVVAPTAATNGPQFADASGRRLSRSSSGHSQAHPPSRYSYTYVEDPFMASSAAAHIPINTHPVSRKPRTAAQSVEQNPDVRNDPIPQTPHQQFTVVVPPPSRLEPQSDFEKFIAKAQQEDRERTERIKQRLSQRSSRVAQARVPPNPHIQYASARSSSGEVSATTTAVAGRTSGGESRRNSRGDRGAGGNESSHRRNSEQLPEEKQQHQQQQHQAQAPRRSHIRNSSWSPSFTSGASQDKTAVHVIGVSEKYKPADPEPKALKRQVSISKKIADYIRPPKPDMVGNGLGGRLGSNNYRRVQTIAE